MMNPVERAEFEKLAVSYYRNRDCVSVEEFYKDMKRIGYVRRLSARYAATTDKERRAKQRIQILNHLVVLANVFGIPGSIELVCRKKRKMVFRVIKPFWLYLKYLPDNIPQDHPMFGVVPYPAIRESLEKL